MNLETGTRNRDANRQAIFRLMGFELCSMLECESLIQIGPGLPLFCPFALYFAKRQRNKHE